MNNVYFSNEGMTSTTANFYANIAKELQNAATERLNSVRFFKTSVAVIGSREKQLMEAGNESLDFIPDDLKTIAEKFLKDIGVFDKMGFGEDFFDSRRQRNDNDVYAQRMCTDNPLLTNGCRSIWQTEEKAMKGVVCWGALFDITKANEKTLKGLIIRIPYGNVGFAKTMNSTTLKANKSKLWPGFDTSINNNTIVTPRIIV